MGCLPSKNIANTVQDATDVDDEKFRLMQAQRQGRRPSVSSECIDPNKEYKFEKKIVEKSEEAYSRIRKAVLENFMFASLDPEQQQDIFNAMSEKKVVTDEIVIKQGDRGDYFYVVDKGEFDVYVHDKPEPVFHYSPGGSFGELALMYNSPRAATVKAITDGILWAVDRETFRHIIVRTSKIRSEKYEQLLSKMDLLEKLTPKERSTIADSLSLVTFNSGEFIIKQGDDNYSHFHFYIVVEGECSFIFTDSQNKSTKVGKVRQGEYFGEKALKEQSKRAVNVVAEENVKCLSMNVATFERLMGPCQEILKRKMSSYDDAEKVHISKLKSQETKE